ncbi:MAG TPA: methyltransferase domain-containing protein, partial [Vicinamibacterales bacterium]|nr:methyltransferase domain-containing protein [Vicinamibacterales bacterium]
AVGIDASLEMLRTARSTAALPAAIASATRLPFSGEAFDIVTAAFVLSHIRDYAAALAEIARVCTAGGRVGISAWGAAGSGASTWSRVASHYTAIDRVERAVDDAIPWHRHFSRPGALGRALCEAGLVDVRETTRQIVVRVPTRDYVAMKCASVEGAILRHVLDGMTWTAFIMSITSALGREFGGTVEYTRETHLARGTRR